MLGILACFFPPEPPAFSTSWCVVHMMSVLRICVDWGNHGMSDPVSAGQLLIITEENGMLACFTSLPVPSRAAYTWQSHLRHRPNIGYAMKVDYS